MKKLLTLLASCFLLLTMAACSKNPDITGYYALKEIQSDGKTVLDEYAINTDLSQIAESYLYLDVTDDKTALLNIYGFEEEMTYDFKSKQFTTNYNDGEPEYVYSFVYENDQLKLTEVYETDGEPYTFVFAKAERPSEPFKAKEETGDEWPGCDPKRVGMDEIGYFNIPSTWYDHSEVDDEYVTLSYADASQSYILQTFAYTQEELANFDSQYTTAEGMLKLVAGNVEENYADQLEDSFYYSARVAGYDAQLCDMSFNDGSLLSYVVFTDEIGTIHIFDFETLDSTAAEHQKEFVDYVMNSYSLNETVLDGYDLFETDLLKVYVPEELGCYDSPTDGYEIFLDGDEVGVFVQAGTKEDTLGNNLTEEELLDTIFSQDVNNKSEGTLPDGTRYMTYTNTVDTNEFYYAYALLKNDTHYIDVTVACFSSEKDRLNDKMLDILSKVVVK